MKRLPAEWEEQETLLLTLPHPQSDWNESFEKINSSYKKLIATITNFQHCTILTHDIEHAKQLLPFKNVDFIKIKTNDTWIRDYGAIDVKNEDKIIGYDFTFNGWGKKYDATLDNAVNQTLFNKNLLKGSLHVKDFVLEGGSIDSNGQGVLLTTSSCIFNPNRNPHLSKKEIKNKLFDFFDLQELIILENGAIIGDDTDAHIDTLARFITKDTIAYATCNNPNDAHFEPLKKMQQELQKTSFNLIPLPLPEPIFHEKRRLPATYANFIFVNNGLIVPTYNDKNDKIALQSLQSKLPFLHVKGVDARTFIQQNGSLHCASINRYKGLR